MVPPERLLNYHLGDGWEPLCKFLGKPVPTDGSEFPNVNESKAFREMVWRGQIKMLKDAAAKLVPLGLTITAVVVAAMAWIHL